MQGKTSDENNASDVIGGYKLISGELQFLGFAFITLPAT
jgi:hypothetical protein